MSLHPAWFKARSHGEVGLVLAGRMMAPSRFQRWCKYGSRCWRSSEAAREGPQGPGRSDVGRLIEQILPTPNIDLSKIPECQKYLNEGSHRRLYTFSPNDYEEMSGIWGNGEVALPGDPPGELQLVDGHPEGGRIHNLMGDTQAFSPDYAPEEMFEIATKLNKASR